MNQLNADIPQSPCNSIILGRFTRLLLHTVTKQTHTHSYTLKYTHIDGLQHEGTMSTKPVFEKIAKIQKLYVPLRGHTTFVLLTPAFTMTITDKIRIFCNDINKTSTSVKLLAINILHCAPKKCPPYYFWNNSVKNKSISIIFGTQTPEET